MKLALLSDAHGNSVALAACLRHVGELGADATYFLGDAVGYLSHPGPAIGMLRDAEALCQKGNHDAMLLGGLPLDPARDVYYRIAPQRGELSADDLAELAAWPDVRRLELDGLRILLAHGSPAPSIVERMYEDTPWQPPEGFAHDVVFIGHTHRPFIRRCGGVELINVGSCGLPRDRGDLASFVVYDCDRRQATIYRVPFDVQRVLELHGDGVHPDVAELFERRGEWHGEVL